MRLAVLNRPNDPLSLRLYQRNLVRELTALGVTITFFAETGPIPQATDVVWDPAQCMRRPPRVLSALTVPFVASIHGYKAFSLPLEEIVFGDEDRQYLLKLKAALIQDWKWLRTKTKSIVAVSRYAAEEAQTAFDIDSSLFQVVYNGVDQKVFTTYGRREPGSYFLAVSNPNPLKNMARILEAYKKLPRDSRPKLVVIAPELKNHIPMEGVRFICRELSHEEMACWYRGASALVFPSLRETFGLPIVEAMACGCPVLTSHDTGCAEIADNAALRVNPRSINSIASGMATIHQNTAYSQILVERGLRRIRKYSWRSGAGQLVKIFESAMQTAQLTQIVGEAHDGCPDKFSNSRIHQLCP